jgi:hypothetical protein
LALPAELPEDQPCPELGAVHEEHEQTGLNLTVHAETAYDHGVLGHGAPVSSSVPSLVQKARPQA